MARVRFWCGVVLVVWLAAVTAATLASWAGWWTF
jgi:hypothetical protein